MEYGFNEFITNNIKINISKQDFYDIMRLKYFGKSSDFQSPVWKRQAAGNCAASVTIPASVTMSSLNKDISAEEGSLQKRITYIYHDWQVGTAYGTFYPFAAPAEMIFERTSPELAQNQLLETASKDASIQI